MNSTFNVKQWAIATVAVFVVLSVIQYFTQSMLLSEAQVARYWRAGADMMSRMHWMYVGNLLFAGLFCYIFTFGYKGKPGIGEGLRYGALIGALISFPKMFTDHVTFYYPGMIVVATGLTMFVGCVLAGIVIGLIYKGEAAKAA